MNAPILAPGGRIDEASPTVPVRVAVLTVSDTRDEESACWPSASRRRATAWPARPSHPTTAPPSAPR
jgi:hypothetical protein